MSAREIYVKHNDIFIPKKQKMMYFPGDNLAYLKQSIGTYLTLVIVIFRILPSMNYLVDGILKVRNLNEL